MAALVRQTLYDKLRYTVSRLSLLPRVIALAWTASARWTMAWVLATLLQAIPPILTVFLTRALVDALVSKSDTRQILAIAACLVITGWCSELLRSWQTYVASVLSELVQDHMHGLVQTQALAIDLQFYDLPENFDHLHRAQSESYYRPALLIQNLGALIQQGVVLVAMLVLLLRFGVLVPLAVTLSALPAALLFIVNSNRLNQWRTDSTQVERKARYFSYLMTSRESAAEVRLFDLGQTLQAHFTSARHYLRKGNRSIAIKQFYSEIAAATCSLGIAGSVMVWFIWRAILGAVSLAELALLYQATFQAGRAMNGASQQLGQLYTNIVFLGNLFDYLSLKNHVVSTANPRKLALPFESGYQLDNVSFQYPGSQRSALANLSLTIPAGKVVAIVGTNGSGKSTLIKLLLRFYDPSSGTITLDGVELRELDVSAIRRSATVLFQQPVPFSATLRQNIEWGSTGQAISDAELETSVEMADLRELISELPNGDQQLLGKWFQGGTELSMGQWQRVALARAIVRDSQLVILDEPTSAMDPWSEERWMKRFKQFARGRTMLIITHRLTTAMAADLIHVMENGQVVESGAHQELLDLGNKYARAWHSQQQSSQQSQAL